ncbi:MAG: AAA family ATPase [Dehalococcoidia bacterium]
MNCSIIAISRTLGAGGEDLGSRLATALGWRYVDKEILDRAAEVAGATPEEMGRAEQRKGLVARILENMARVGAGSMAVGGAPEPIAVMMDAGPTYEQLIVDVIKEVAAQGNVVIVAHGASIPLAGTMGLVRVLVTASTKARVGRVASDQKVAPSKATEIVADSDKSRADYFRRFYHLDHEGPTNYDLVLNTDVLSVEEAAAAVLAIAK